MAKDLLATKLKKNVDKYSVLITLILVREGFGASLVDLGNYKLCFLSEETLFIVHSLHSEHIVPTPILKSVPSQFHHALQDNSLPKSPTRKKQKELLIN